MQTPVQLYRATHLISDFPSGTGPPGTRVQSAHTGNDDDDDDVDDDDDDHDDGGDDDNDGDDAGNPTAWFSPQLVWH